MMTRIQSSQGICADGSRMGALVRASCPIKSVTCAQPVALWSCASTCMFGTRGDPLLVLTAKQAQCSRWVIRPIAAFVAGSIENRREGPSEWLDMFLPRRPVSSRIFAGCCFPHSLPRCMSRQVARGGPLEDRFDVCCSGQKNGPVVLVTGSSEFDPKQALTAGLRFQCGAFCLYHSRVWLRAA